MFAAHMDSIGLIVTHIQEDGFLRVGRLGGRRPQGGRLYPRPLPKRGAGGAGPRGRKADFGKLKLDECFVDIRGQGPGGGPAAGPGGGYRSLRLLLLMSGNKVISPYMDNRVSCAILLAALERLRAPENDVYFVFTVQEEVGLRGGKTAAWALTPDCGVCRGRDRPGRHPGQ